VLQSFGIIIASYLGLLVSFYIFYKKMKNEELFCISGESCNFVVTSKYNKTLGISNEIIGMLYYGMVFLVYTALSIPSFDKTAHELVPLLDFGLLLMTGSAAFFSIYLIFIQAFVLKKWCEWCLVSATMSIIIFILVLL